MSTNKCLKLELQHLGQIMPIEKESFEFPWTEDQIKHELINNKTAFNIGLFQNDTLFAYSLSHLIQDELHINNFAVKKSKRNEGLGFELLERTILQSKAKTIYLEVNETNNAAIALYEKYGFKSFYTRKNYYPDGANALIMIF